MRVGVPRDYVDFARRVLWLLRPSKTWLVEYYDGVGEDYGVPEEAATGAWRVANRLAANACAEGSQPACARAIRPRPLPERQR